MTKSVKRVSFVLCILMLAVFFVACNPKKSGGGGEGIQALKDTTISATWTDADGVSHTNGPLANLTGNSSITVKKGTEITLTGAQPAPQNSDGYTAKYKWQNGSTDISNETATTYKFKSDDTGTFDISFNAQYAKGSDATDWAKATAHIVVEQEIAAAPTGVTLMYGEADATKGLFFKVNDKDVNLQLGFDEQDAGVQIRWYKNNVLVSDENKNEKTYTVSTVEPGAQIIKASIRTAAYGDFAASEWVDLISNINVYGLKISPEKPDIWSDSDQEFLAELIPATTPDFKLEWSVSDENGGTVQNGVSINKETGVTHVEPSVPVGTKVLVKASTTVDGVALVGSTVATVKEGETTTPVDPDAPKLSGVKINLTEGALDEEVLPDENGNIAFVTYENTKLGFSIQSEPLEKGASLQVQRTIFGTLADQNFTDQHIAFNTNSGVADDEVKVVSVKVRASKTGEDGKQHYSPEITVTASVDVIEEPVDPVDPKLPSQVKLGWVAGGDAANNSKVADSNRISLTAYVNELLTLSVNPVDMIDGVGLKYRAIIGGGRGPWKDLSTDSTFDIMYSEVTNGAVSMRFEYYAYSIDTDGNIQESERVNYATNAFITVKPLPPLDAPQGVFIDVISGAEQINGVWTVVEGDDLVLQLNFDKVDGLVYKIKWVNGNGGVVGDEELFMFTDVPQLVEGGTFHTSLRVSIVAEKYDENGDLINSSTNNSYLANFSFEVVAPAVDA